MSEEDIFKRKPRLGRSPTRETSEREESGILSDFLSFSSNAQALENTLTEDVVESIRSRPANSGRKSVSFRNPTLSSTFYVASEKKDSENLLNLSFEDLSLENTSPRPTVSAQFDHFEGAEATFSEFQLSESNSIPVDNRLQVLSLKFLSELVCVNHSIEYSEAKRIAGEKSLLERVNRELNVLELQTPNSTTQANTADKASSVLSPQITNTSFVQPSSNGQTPNSATQENTVTRRISYFHLKVQIQVSFNRVPTVKHQIRQHKQILPTKRTAQKHLKRQTQLRFG